MPARSRPSVRIAISIVLSLALLAFIGLGVLWLLDRTRPRETPRWSDAAFVPLHEAPGAPEGWSERWTVALHPGCPHCRASLAALAGARDRSGAPIRLTALLVDVSSPPPDSALARLEADETWWDAENRWRRRWGHRVYGETFCFDTAGTLTRLLPPFEGLEDASAALASSELEDSL
jgi:hypothetical protein